MYHRLLERQLRKFLPGYPSVSEEMQELLRAISNSYEHFDNDRVVMETAMRESSDELMAKKSALNALLDRQSQVLESLREAATSLFPDQASIVNEDLLRLADIVQEEIQKRHIAEARKEQSDQRLMDIIENLDLGMARYDLNGQITQVVTFRSAFWIVATGYAGHVGIGFSTGSSDSRRTQNGRKFRTNCGSSCV